MQKAAAGLVLEVPCDESPSLVSVSLLATSIVLCVCVCLCVLGETVGILFDMKTTTVQLENFSHMLE